MKVTSETGITVTEESFLPEDPTAEQIVGEENCVDVSDLPVSDSDDNPPQTAGYKCANCTFRSNLLSEMEEHVNGTGHGKFETAPVEPVQPELFSTPGVIQKRIQVPIPDDELNLKRAKLADLYQEALNVKEDKKSADSAFNEQLKSIDNPCRRLRES